jgi:hypothetical protein
MMKISRILSSLAPRFAAAAALTVPSERNQPHIQSTQTA